MARYKKYIETNVLDEAKKRIHHVFDIFDTVVVMFSGGKDSLAVLHLVHEVAQERGIDKVKVCFRDEELIPQVVIDFVQSYRDMPWVDMKYLTVPLASNKFVLGASTGYTQWDPKREWVRPKPEYGLNNSDIGFPDDTVWDQYTTDDMVAAFYKGKVALVNGIRASESLIRLRSTVNKLNENYINASASKRASLVKPIFDWEENDIFRYFYDRGIKYCPIYDSQTWNREQLRVSSPLHAEAAKRLDKLATLDPDLYERILEIFPEVAVQSRYWGEFDRDSLMQEYGQSFEGIWEWIHKHITDSVQLAKAVKEFKGVQIRAKVSPDSYPVDYVLKQFMGGGYKRVIIPLAQPKGKK